MARKTLNVKDTVNALHDNLNMVKTVEEKRAICNIIEYILFSANAYAGFSYSFWDFITMHQYDTVDEAIAAGVGTEYDRVYYTSNL